LADGRIAINTNTASPGLFFKDSAGTGIVKVGPVHVGTTAPNSVPASGGSSGNYTGEQWLDTSVSPAQMKVWNGSTWVGIVADELPVSKLQDGAARQLIQTDAAGTGVEWTSNVDVPGTLDVTSTATFDSIAQHPLGTAGAPTITFTGDTNTGLYSPGADQVAISTNGTGRLFVDASGNVGVGSVSTSSFQSASSTVLSLRDTASSNIASLKVLGGAGAGAIAEYGATNGIGFCGTSGAHDFVFYTNSSERMRLDSSGRLGLGTSIPGSFEPSGSNLVVGTGSGDQGITVYSGAASQGLIYFADGTSGAQKYTGFISYDHSANAMRFGTNDGNERLRIDSSGRVGVGTTSAISKLHVSNSGAEGFEFTPGSATNTNLLTHYNRNGSFVYVNSQVSAASHQFFIGASEAARIDSSGRLGLGTSSADNKLSVGIASADEGIELKATYNGARVARFALLNPGVDNTPYIGSVSGNDFGFITSGTRRMTLTAGGSLGIGTTAPNSVFQVNSGTNLGGLLIGFNSGSSNFYDADLQVFRTGNGTERARIDSSGRLLVGTSTAAGNNALQIHQNNADGGGAISLRLGLDATSINAAGYYLGTLNFGNQQGGIGAQIRADSDAAWSGTGSSDNPSRLVFSVTRDAEASPTERMRINNAGATANYAAESVYHASSAAGAGTTHRLYTGNYSATATFGGTTSFLVWTNGNVENTNNSYGAISDIKLKENIVNANSQWNDLKALQVRNYNFKEGQTHTQIGLIAQEAELISPGLVSETPDRDAEGNDLGTVTKSVNYSVLYMKAVKALQEAMERIEQLENSNADLLARVTALEAQ
jgi:hypothetical protein